jgi:D-sedoheptulose 7-phosphate isomerase
MKKKSFESETIKSQIRESVKLKEKLLVSDNTIKNIVDSSALITETLQKQRRVFLCGNGGSAADCLHWEGEMVGRLKTERQALNFSSLVSNTSTLTSIGNDYAFDTIFSRQVKGIGRKGDLLICLSTSGYSPNIINAAREARNKKMKILSLTGQVTNELAGISDINIAVPSSNTQRVQEIHILIIHLICELVEKTNPAA